jgi:hypothetical protein
MSTRLSGPHPGRNLVMLALERGGFLGLSGVFQMQREGGQVGRR